jgi:hypothetical protein
MVCDHGQTRVALGPDARKGATAERTERIFTSGRWPSPAGANKASRVIAILSEAKDPLIRKGQILHRSAPQDDSDCSDTLRVKAPAGKKHEAVQAQVRLSRASIGNVREARFQRESVGLRHGAAHADTPLQQEVESPVDFLDLEVYLRTRPSTAATCGPRAPISQPASME